MSHLLVLGEGWLGSAVARVAGAVAPVSSVDPPLVAELCRRDAAATRALRDLIERRGVTAVINACGLVRGAPEDLHDANVEFPTWVCRVLDGLGVRLVHVGSASEYGDPGTAEPVDERAPVRAAGTYAETKAAGTRAVLDARDAGLDATVARVFNIVGHPVPAVSPVHQWLTDLRSLPADGGAVEVWWPATIRDFVRMDDVAASLIALSRPGDRPGLVNVCSGVGLAYGDIVRALADRLGVDARIESLDRPGIATVVGDPSLLRSVTGTVPRMDLQLLAGTAVPDDQLVGDRAAGPGAEVPGGEAPGGDLTAGR